MNFEWETPQRFFDDLNQEFNFDIDLCAWPSNAKCQKYYTPEDDIDLCAWPSNAKCQKYYTPEDDSLSQVWLGVCWLNPPYDRNIGLWMEKAYRSAQTGATIVCLIQSRSTDTAWWHNYVMRASEIRFIRDRLCFGIDKKFTRANISNLLVIFRPYCTGPPIISPKTYDGRDYK